MTCKECNFSLSMDHEASSCIECASMHLMISPFCQEANTNYTKLFYKSTYPPKPKLKYCPSCEEPLNNTQHYCKINEENTKDWLDVMSKLK